MTSRENSENNKIMLEEDSLDESDDYLPSVLGMLNGYCKVNFVVPQTSTFYSSQSLFPINAKVNSTILNNTIQKSPINNSPDIIADMLKNIKTDDNVDDKTLNKTSIKDFQVYSKPSYSENTKNLTKKEDTKRSISPKSRKKRNKYSKIETASASTTNNQTPVLSDRSEQNFSTGYYNQYDSERSDEGIYSKQDQEFKIKQLRIIKNNFNNTPPSRNRATLSESNSENGIQNDNLSPQSQCPLCFGLYPTPDIEAHASECSI